MEVKSRKLEGKQIALCVTGSVAAIEAPRIAREISRHGAEVTAFMSGGAREIIHPNTMEFATGKKVVTRLTGRLEHLQEYDLILVAPATANSISKFAGGIADTAVTSLVFASDCKVVVAPAMHLKMYENTILQENIERLKGLGFLFIEPVINEASAKLANISFIVDFVISLLFKRDLEGLQVLVTAGPTVEYLDPVRVITNRSSGKMGIEIAREAYFRGADVKLVYGPGSVDVPGYIDVIRVETSKDMLGAVKEAISDCDVFVSAAAVSDFTVEKKDKKIDSREGGLDIMLTPAKKILDEITSFDCFKVGFKALHMVSEDELVGSSHRILKEYGLDLVVANDVSKGAFGSNENEVYLVDKEGEAVHVPRALKSKVAERLWGRVAENLGR